MAHVTRKKILLIGASGIFVLLAAVTFLFLAYDQPLPQGKPGVDADQLAQMMERAVRVDQWKKTGAIEWTFRGSHHHLWDRKRNLARVRWDDKEVLINLQNQKGISFIRGQQTPEEENSALLQKAYALWANDSFWLNPIAKLRDRGVSLAVVDLDSRENQSLKHGLLASYGSGGVTPGDSYLWILDPQGRPLKWRMWVSIIPIGGLEATFEEWHTLSTGAVVSTFHRLPFGLELHLTKIRAAKDLNLLVPGEDPFQRLGVRE